MPLVRKAKDPATPSKPGAVGGILTALASANPEERWAAARAAVDVAGGVDALAAALRTESDPRVREAMFTSLARIGTSESANRLLPLLRCDDAQLRTGALDALRMMGTAVREMLPGLLLDHDEDVRILSCELARGLPNDEATTLLCVLLGGEQQVNVCAAAIEVLAEVGNPAALPTLAECGRRFRDAPFLGFAIRIATVRINAQSASTRG
jgi:HEAT repeat protein